MAQKVDSEFTLGGYPATLTIEQESIEVTGDYQPHLRYECRECGEVIQPRTRIPERKFVPGVRRGEARFTVSANQYAEFPPPEEFPPHEIVERVGDELLTFKMTNNWREFDRTWKFIYQVVDFQPIEESEMVRIDTELVEDGLYEKYRVFKEPENAPQHPVPVVTSFYDFEGAKQELEEVEGFIFPLKPDTDPHARVALAAYAWSIQSEKPFLSADLLGVLSEYEV